LEELVHIDLEFRWKVSQTEGGNEPPPIDTYLQQFPELEVVKLGLIRAEFELASRFDRPVSIDDYVQRFGGTVGGKQLQSVLNEQLKKPRPLVPVKPGTSLGRYKIVNEHGRGGFGAVWRAKDTKLGRRIAVKQLGQRLANDSQSRRRFISEARVTARLEHPGIVPVYDISNVEEDHAYYTMRLIQGRTMAEAIDDLDQLPDDSIEFQLLRQRLLQAFVDACQTIEYAHAQGVIHRDLKPQNMIVGDYGETILLDWGLASVIGEADDPEQVEEFKTDPEVLSKEESMETLRGGAMGTPAYMPPEQARGEMENISKSSDVYSLGATLYQIITRRIPFTDGPLATLLDRVKTSDIPTAWELNNRIEKPLSCIAARAMQNRPADRYPSVAALVDDVQRFLADQPISAYQDPMLSRIARWIRKHPTAAAAAAMLTLFAFAAIFTAVMINNAWMAKEAKRITDLQIAAERAAATAESQIKNNRFDAAAKTLASGFELIHDEPQLQSLAQQIEQRHLRTQQIVEFYALSSKAQEETFFDRTNRSAIYCQAALDELRILDNPNWWNALPDQDLSPIQKEQLQSEVYRITTLLASMRLAETAKQAVSLEMLVDPQSVNADEQAVASLKSAGFAAGVANRFRPSRAMQMIEEISNVVQGRGTAIDLTNINPLNAVDSAVMGSILDNNVDPQGNGRAAISAILEMRDPNVVAKQWLDDALKYNPDWFWLPVFMGHSQVRIGEPEEGIRTLSHAVGIRPDYWVGYQYRAIASLAAATNETSRKRRSELLNASSQDIQRALDLEPFNSELFWTKALIQYQSGVASDQIADTFLTAFELHPNLGEISGGHYSGISKMFYSRAQAFVELQTNENDATPEMSVLEIVIALWQNDVDEAKKISNAAEGKYPDNRLVKSMARLVANASDLANAQPFEFDSDSRFAWHFYLSNAIAHRRAGQLSDESIVLRNALDLAKVEWQISKTQIALARCLTEMGEVEEAVRLVRNTISIDRAVDIGQVAAAAEKSNSETLVRICQEYLDQTKSKLDFANPETRTITQPALLNSGFELGLSYHWAPFAQRKTASAWNNFGQSRTVAESVSDNVKEGRRCLRLRLNCPLEDESYGMMNQSVPVTAGTKYRLGFWVRGEFEIPGGVTVGLLDEQGKSFRNSKTIDDATTQWKRYEFDFMPDRDEATLGIRVQGQGNVWLDDFTMTAIDD
jgi:serine/threonine protein kinase